MPLRQTPRSILAATSFASRNRFLALWLAVLLVPALTFGFGAWISWRQVEAETHERITRVVDLLHEQALRTFEVQEKLLTAVEARTAGLSWDAINQSAAIHLFLRTLTEGTPTTGIGLASPDGRLLTGNTPGPGQPKPDVSERDYFQAIRAGHAGLFIGDVVRTRPFGLLAFPVARARRDSTGRPDGSVVVAGVSPDIFTEYFERLAENPGDRLALVRLDGLVLARHPPLPHPLADAEGYRLPAGSMPQNVSPDGRAGPIEVRSPVDGSRLLYSARRVDPYPVVVLYGLDPSALRQAWAQRLIAPALVTGLAGLLLALLTLLAQRAARRESLALTQAATEADHARAEAERRAEAEARLRQAERIAALGQVTAGVAHDMNNLVQSVLAAVKLLDRRADDGRAVRQLTAHLGESAERGLRIVRRMLEFSRPTTSGGAFDLAPCLAALAEILGSTLGSQVRVHCAVPPGLPAALADAAEFQTVMLNLAVNARDAMPEGGALRITAAAETREEKMPALDPQAPGPQRSGRYLRVAVADTGSGMSPEVLARVGEAFFTTKPPGKGTGLGLVLARRFAENAGGALHIESEAGRGTTITLWLPAASAPAETMPA